MAMPSQPPATPRKHAVGWAAIRQAIQTVFAAVAAYVLAEWMQLPQGYWAVMTAILVVQSSVGASLGLALDRLLATIVGAAVGGALVLIFGHLPHATPALLALSVLALAYVANLRSSLRLAPVTAAIVILADPHLGSPLQSALNRVVEISLGALIAVATSLLILPSRAGQALAQQVAGILPAVAAHLKGTIGIVLGVPRADAEYLAINAKVRAAFKTMDTNAAEARLELAGRMASHADPAAIVRTLRRLWYTAMIAARAAEPLHEPAVLAALKPYLEQLQAQVDRALDGLASAYRGGARCRRWQTWTARLTPWTRLWHCYGKTEPCAPWQPTTSQQSSRCCSRCANSAPTSMIWPTGLPISRAAAPGRMLSTFDRADVQQSQTAPTHVNTSAGEIGALSMRTPNSDNASSTAEMIAAAAGIVPTSPTPFTPSGLFGDGLSM